MPLRSRIRRLLWLVPLGVLLAALSGYIGALFALPAWIAVMFLKAITLQLRAFFEALGAPALYGIQYMWPVTCVLLPLGSLAVRRATTPTILGLTALSAAAATLLIYIRGMTDFGTAGTDRAFWFAVMGATAGAASGLVFGLVLRRLDRKHDMRSAKDGTEQPDALKP